eukprot:scaffold16716_cov134-Isochrysis_galbana.AAC.7
MADVVMEPVFWRADETAFDLFNRLSRPALRLNDPSFGPHHLIQLQVGEVLEVLGEPGSGKTATLFEALMRCILPTEHGGLGAYAVLIDTDGVDLVRLALDIRRYHRATLDGRDGEQACGDAVRHAKSCWAPESLDPLTGVPGGQEAEIEFAHSCLSRLHVLRAGDRHELILALHAVLGYISRPAPGSARRWRPAPAVQGAVHPTNDDSSRDQDDPVQGSEQVSQNASKHGSMRGLPPPDQIQLLAIDSLSRFQWFGRAQRRMPSLHDPDAEIARILGHILLRRSFAVVWARSPSGKPEEDAFPIPTAADPFTSMCAYTLCLRRRHALRDASESVDDVVEGLLMVPGATGAKSGSSHHSPRQHSPPPRFDLLLRKDGRIYIRPGSAR